MGKRKFGESIQRFGRTLLLPIGVLAPIGMILGISGALVQTYMIARFPFLGNETVNALLVSIRSIAGVIFDNIPLLFAMGVAYGMSQRDKGIAVFASVVGYLSLIITMNIWLVLTGKLADPAIMGQVGQIKVLGIQTLNISQRLAQRLLFILNGYGNHVHIENHIIHLSQEQLAQMLMCSRQTINQELHLLEQQGILKIAFRKVEILDVQKLHALAHSAL